MNDEPQKPTVSMWMSYINHWCLRTLVLLAGYRVIMFTVEGIDFEETVVTLLVIAAYKIFSPNIVVLQAPPK